MVDGLDGLVQGVDLGGVLVLGIVPDRAQVRSHLFEVVAQLDQDALAGSTVVTLSTDASSASTDEADRWGLFVTSAPREHQRGKHDGRDADAPGAL